MRRLHRSLLAEIRKQQRRRAHTQANDSYLSSGHFYWDVSILTLRTIAKAWLKHNRGISQTEFLAVLDGLYRGRSYEEKITASMLLADHSAARASVGPKQLDAWLDGLVGWAEIDALCQNTFTADEMLEDWPEWKRFIGKLSRDKNINKRRAALVLLTTPVRRSNDERFSLLAFDLVEVQKSQREIIITKAVSWLLRSMVQHHKRAVSDYVKENRDSLPAIAVRETVRKIKTGRK